MAGKKSVRPLQRSKIADFHNFRSHDLTNIIHHNPPQQVPYITKYQLSYDQYTQFFLYLPSSENPNFFPRSLLFFQIHANHSPSNNTNILDNQVPQFPWTLDIIHLSQFNFLHPDSPRNSGNFFQFLTIFQTLSNYSIICTIPNPFERQIAPQSTQNERHFNSSLFFPEKKYLPRRSAPVIPNSQIQNSLPSSIPTLIHDQNVQHYFWPSAFFISSVPNFFHVVHNEIPRQKLITLQISMVSNSLAPSKFSIDNNLYKEALHHFWPAVTPHSTTTSPSQAVNRQSSEAHHLSLRPNGTPPSTSPHYDSNAKQHNPDSTSNCTYTCSPTLTPISMEQHSQHYEIYYSQYDVFLVNTITNTTSTVPEQPPTLTQLTKSATRNRLVTNFLLNSSAYVYTAQSTTRLPSPNFISKLLGNLQHTSDCSYQRSINFTTISSGQQGLLSIITRNRMRTQDLRQYHATTLYTYDTPPLLPHFPSSSGPASYTHINTTQLYATVPPWCRILNHITVQPHDSLRQFSSSTTAYIYPTYDLTVLAHWFVLSNRYMLGKDGL